MAIEEAELNHDAPLPGLVDEGLEPIQEGRIDVDRVDVARQKVAGEGHHRISRKAVGAGGMPATLCSRM
jgi:hypothetical protein